MTITVKISDFRKDISSYIDQMISSQGVINIKRGNVVVAKVLPEIRIKNEKKINMAENVLDDLESVRKKIKIKTKAKNGTELANEIDRIVYGVDRNGQKIFVRQ